MIDQTIQSALDALLDGQPQNLTLRHGVESLIETVRAQVIDERNGYYAAKIQKLQDENALLRATDEDLCGQLNKARAAYADAMRK